MFKKKLTKLKVGELCCTEFVNKKNKNKNKWLITKGRQKKDVQGNILVDKRNEIIFGCHEYCAFLELYGPNYEITVTKIEITKRIYLYLISLLFIIFIFLGKYFYNFLLTL